MDDDVVGIICQALHCGAPCFRIPTKVKSCYRPPCPPELVAVTVILGGYTEATFADTQRITFRAVIARTVGVHITKVTITGVAVGILSVGP